jgi:hypothetical protein
MFGLSLLFYLTIKKDMGLFGNFAYIFDQFTNLNECISYHVSAMLFIYSNHRFSTNPSNWENCLSLNYVLVENLLL